MRLLLLVAGLFVAACSPGPAPTPRASAALSDGATTSEAPVSFDAGPTSFLASIVPGPADLTLVDVREKAAKLAGPVTADRLAADLAAAYSGDDRAEGVVPLATMQRLLEMMRQGNDPTRRIFVARSFLGDLIVLAGQLGTSPFRALLDESYRYAGDTFGPLDSAFLANFERDFGRLFEYCSADPTGAYCKPPQRI